MCYTRTLRRALVARLGLPTPRFPSQATLHRIFKGLDAPAFEAVVAQWAEAVLVAHALPPLPDVPLALEAVALDGKTLRGSVATLRGRARPAQLLAAWQTHLGYWHIENKLHWVRDVTFDEDRSQVRAGRAHQILAALRNTVIGRLRVSGATNIAKALRHYAAQPGAALRLVEGGE